MMNIYGKKKRNDFLFCIFFFLFLLFQESLVIFENASIVIGHCLIARLRDTIDDGTSYYLVTLTIGAESTFDTFVVT